MKVEPNSTAEISAGATPPTSAGRAMPTAWTPSAASSRSGLDQRRPSPAHTAEEGMAARPTTTQAPPPIQPGDVWLIAATRKVPAMM